MKQFQRICIALIGAVSVLAVGTLSAHAESIYLGVSGPLTGNSAQYGAQWKKGFDLALDEINADGGINGKKLEYIFEDSQSDPKQAVVIAQKFVADPRIVAELGDFASPASMAATPIYQRAGLLQFGFTNSHPDFTKGGDFTWSNCPTQADVAPFQADYVYALGLKTIAVFYLNTDWGKISLDITAKRLAEHGITIAAQEGYLPDEKDFKAAITRINTKKLDGIMLISYYTDAALIIQQVRSAGITLPVVANSPNHSPKFLELGGAAVEGVYVSSNFSIDDPRTEVQTFVAAFRAKYKEDPDYFATHAYDTMHLLASALRIGGTDRKAVRDALLQLKDVPSVVYGTISFDPVTRRVANPKDVRLMVNGGKFAMWDGKLAITPK